MQADDRQSSGGGIRRSFVHFDLSPYAGQIAIDNSTLHVFNIETPLNNTGTVNVHHITGPSPHGGAFGEWWGADQTAQNPSWNGDNTVFDVTPVIGSFPCTGLEP